MFQYEFMLPSGFILNLPKAELHLHLEGSVDPGTLSEISLRHPRPFTSTNPSYTPAPESGRPLTPEDALALYTYSDFTGFIRAFKTVTECLRTADDFELITYRLMQRLHAENILHAEVYVSAGVYLWRGGGFDSLFEGMERGRQRGQRDFGISLLWLFDAVRQFGSAEAQRVFEAAARLRHRGVVGVGIGGDERQHPPELFQLSYAYARAQGLHLTAHAGETAGPHSISGALDALHAERIGHALTAASDPALLARLVEDQVPLEICITSNLRTGVCASASDHPLERYFRAGALVVLNSDDPAMFGTSLSGEYQLAHDTFGFTESDLCRLAANSFRASFLEEDRKKHYLSLVEAAAQQT